MPLLEINIVPVGTQSPSFSSHVGNALRLIENKGLKYQITPTCTVIEGEIGDLMRIAQDIHQDALTNGANRVVTNMTIDDRTDKPLHLDDTVQRARESIH